MCEGNEKKKLDLEGLEGLRGDGEAKWYVVHTYSGYENKVKVNIEKMAETAIGLLRRKMSGKKYIGGNTVIAGNIIERGSVADRR